MCGIAGKIYFGQKTINRNIEIPLIQKTLSILHHRGPNDEGFLIDENVWLGATRLSIIDLSSAGHQPMRNEDGTIFLVFNGELYNYQEIKQHLTKRHKFISDTDSEVLIHLYEEKGIKCLDYLRGMFAFAIWDGRKQELFIVRDRIGKKPLKYFYNADFFVFASEFKAFIDHPGVPKEIDWDAIDEFLTYQYVPSPKTGFKNIWKLPPAHYMIVKTNGKMVVKRYWSIDFTQKEYLSEAEWEEKLLEKLKESIKLRLQSDVSVGIHLSGGMDSGLITALVSQQVKKPVKTFSIGFKESNYDELPYARLISQKYHTDHHEVIVQSDVIELLPNLVYQYEEPFADPSVLPTWVLMKESKRHFTVCLNGDGGDENFAGYRRYQVMKLFTLLTTVPFKDRWSSLLNSLYRYYSRKDITQIARILKLSYSNYKIFYQDLISFLDINVRNKLYTTEFKQKIKQSRSKFFLLDRFKEAKNLELIDQLLYVDITTYLPEVILTKADIASMVFSLESRSPFIDHEFMELAAKMPSNLKLQGLDPKIILRKIAKKYLPEEYSFRKKQAFIPPLAHWFCGKYAAYLKSQLEDKIFLSYGLFNGEVIKNLLNKHIEGKEDNTYILWTLLVFKNWMDRWFK